MDSRHIQDKITKWPTINRQLLQKTVLFYDPLVLFSTFYVVAKTHFQETSCKGMQWEEILPMSLELVGTHG